MKRVALSLLLFLLVACNYNYAKNGAGAGGRNPFGKLEEGQIPDYAAVQFLVIGPRCLSCHSNQAGNKGNLNLETYRQLRANLANVTYRTLEAKNMPAEGLSESERRVLELWFDAGAPEKIIGGGEKPDPDLDRGPNDWNKIKSKIFTPKCSACHAEENPEKGLNLSDLPMVKAKAGEIFRRTIIDQDMPKAPYPALTPRERRVLLKWFDSGMPE